MCFLREESLLSSARAHTTYSVQLTLRSTPAWHTHTLSLAPASTPTHMYARLHQRRGVGDVGLEVPLLDKGGEPAERAGMGEAQAAAPRG